MDQFTISSPVPNWFHLAKTWAGWISRRMSSLVFCSLCVCWYPIISKKGNFPCCTLCEFYRSRVISEPRVFLKSGTWEVLLSMLNSLTFDAAVSMSSWGHLQKREPALYLSVAGCLLSPRMMHKMEVEYHLQDYCYPVFTANGFALQLHFTRTLLFS